MVPWTGVLPVGTRGAPGARRSSTTAASARWSASRWASAPPWRRASDAQSRPRWGLAARWAVVRACGAPSRAADRWLERAEPSMRRPGLPPRARSAVHPRPLRHPQRKNARPSFEERAFEDVVEAAGVCRGIGRMPVRAGLLRRKAGIRRGMGRDEEGREGGRRDGDVSRGCPARGCPLTTLR